MRDVVHDGRTFTVNAVTVLPFRQTEFFKNNFEKPLDNQHKMCYNDKAVRDRNPPLNKWVANLPPNMKGVYYD